MSDVLSRFLIGVKATSQDMGFGTNSLVSGFGFGLIGKTLHLYSDRTWEVINKSGNVVATGDADIFKRRKEKVASSNRKAIHSPLDGIQESNRCNGRFAGILEAR